MTSAAGSAFVTGGEGFVGTHLRRCLLAAGWDVHAYSGDVRDADGLADELRICRPAAVLHLAARSSVAESWTDERAVWDVNAGGALNLLLAAQAHAAAARVLLVSSAEVYGAVPEYLQPIPEERPTQPLSPYARSKAAAEIAASGRDLEVVVARPFNHLGPGQDARFAIASFVDQVARIERGEAEPVIRVGNLSARRDFTDVRCVVEAYVRLLDREVEPGTYNVCSGYATSVGGVLDRLLALASRPISVDQDPTRLRPVDVPLLLGDATRLREATGWRPSRDLDETLSDMLADRRRQEAAEG
jgi:GDP-4-dehydro-6-deoxy-D-mannose reductase